MFSNNIFWKTKEKKKKGNKINNMEYLNKLTTSNLLSYIFAIITGALMGIGLCKLL